MRKIYFLFVMLAVVSTVANAQVVKHFTSADTAVNSWWVGNSAIAQWQLTQCSEAPDAYYALFTADLSKLGDGEQLGAWCWATDIKISDVDMPGAGVQDAIDNAQSKLFINFYMNVFDGVNAADSLGFSFELATPTGGIGWPGTSIAPVTPNEWNWVSLDLSALDFSGITPGDAESISLIKFAIQPIKAYDKQDGMFKFGLQDIAVSKGAAAAPAAKPCSTVDVDENASVETMVFYPNPASTLVNFNNKVSGTVSDLAGRQVAVFSNTRQLNVENLKNGMYLIHIGDNTMKLIKE